MKTKITILALLISVISFGQTRVNNSLNRDCSVSECHMKLGLCQGDPTNSDNEEETAVFGFFVWYVDQDVDFKQDSFTLTSGRLEFRNGANFITNGADININNFCDIDGNVTEIVFIGGGGFVEPNAVQSYINNQPPNSYFRIRNSHTETIEYAGNYYPNMIGDLPDGTYVIKAKGSKGLKFAKQ